MSGNRNLIGAKRARNDEFYTRLDDIEKELEHYPGAFAGKRIYLPCDAPGSSRFWDYFIAHADGLGWTTLTASQRNPGGRGMCWTATRVPSGMTREERQLDGDGDFLSPECLELLDASHIVATNLPFSSFRAYIRTMMEHGRDFIVIGGKNGGKYQDTIGYVIDGRMRLGANEGRGTMDFDTPEGTSASVGAYWFTTLYPDCGPRPLVPSKRFSGHESDYPRYANYDAIEVSRISDIPADYAGKMGVPVTFLEFFDPDRWELLGTNATVLENAPQDPEIKANSHLYRRHNLYLEQDGGEYQYKRCYDRLIIRNRFPEQ